MHTESEVHFENIHIMNLISKTDKITAWDVFFMPQCFYIWPAYIYDIDMLF